MCVKSLNRVIFVVIFPCTLVVITNMDSDDESVSLHENDVSGTSLDGRDVDTLNIPKLKRWFVCRRL